MIQKFKTLEEYNNYTDSGTTLHSGIIYFIEEDESMHFYTNNIDGEAKVYNGGDAESLMDVVKQVIEGNTTKIIIPNGVTEIRRNCFYNLYELKEVVVPDSVQYIGNSAFENCSQLTTINIPNGVTSLYNGVFKNCRSLSNITMPNVTHITDDTFEGCTSLPTENNIRYIDTLLVGVADKTLTTYTIKEGTKWIGPSAFSDCTNLQNIIIPDSVTKIDSGAFVGCTSLQSITIPSSVTQFDGGAMFKDCTSLTSVTFQNNITKIGINMFENCTSLTDITIPSSVTKIDNEAFKGCSSLTSVTIPNSVTSLGANVFANCSSLASIIALKTTAPSISYNTFKDIKTKGTLRVPKGSSSSYDKWMKDPYTWDTEYYLGYYNWTKVEAK